MSEAEEVSGLALLVGRDKEGPYLIGGKCDSCGEVCFPKQSICPRCTGRNIAEVPLSRAGKLYTFTEVHQKPPDYHGRVPYLIGRVVLPEGVFVLTQLEAGKEELRINMDMELLIGPICRDESGKEWLSYKFRPVRLGSENRRGLL